MTNNREFTDWQIGDLIALDEYNGDGTNNQGTDLYRPDMTHFHPFQDPEDAARIIAEWIG